MAHKNNYNLDKTLKELHTVGLLTDSEQITYRLIDRYKNKVSARLLAVQANLQEKAKELSKEMASALVYKHNPFLSLLPKSKKFKPIRYKKYKRFYYDR